MTETNVSAFTDTPTHTVPSGRVSANELDDGGQYARFVNLTRKLLQVPKREVDSSER